METVPEGERRTRNWESTVEAKESKIEKRNVPEEEISGEKSLRGIDFHI